MLEDKEFEKITVSEVVQILKAEGYKVTFQPFFMSLLSRKGYEDSYSWCDGTRAEGTKYYVLADKLYEVPFDDEGSTGSGDEWKYEGIRLGEYLNEQGIKLADIEAIIEKDFSYCTWEKDPREHYSATIYLPKGQFKEENIKKIRRRVEDVLRKSNPEKIIWVACLLGVKL